MNLLFPSNHAPQTRLPRPHHRSRRPTSLRPRELSASPLPLSPRPFPCRRTGEEHNQPPCRGRGPAIRFQFAAVGWPSRPTNGTPGKTSGTHFPFERKALIPRAEPPPPFAHLTSDSTSPSVNLSAEIALR